MNKNEVKLYGKVGNKKNALFIFILSFGFWKDNSGSIFILHI